jgi:Ca2+-binding EF-hand superfamily protein
VRKKTPGCLMSVGICVDIQDSELTRGAQDTHFKDRVWHYCNTDGSFRNGGIMVPAKDQKTKLAYSTGDVITVQLNCEAGELTFLHNGLEIEGSIIRGVRHASFLERQAAAKDAREPVPEGVGEFYLMLSMSRGDMAEAEESVAELRYTTHEGNYPWHQPIAPNYPSIETGTPPFAFALSRPLPPGIELDPDTGIISGAPEGRNSMDMAAWREFCFQMYKGRVGDLAWKKSRTALLKELGTGLDAQGIAERARALFAEFDADGSGEIDLKELGAAMARLNVLLTTEELMHMAADVDIDGSAEIGVEEFSEMLQQMYSAKDKQSSWKKASLAICKRLGTGLDVEFELPLRTREVFNEFDDDRSGKIDMVELFHALTAMGVEVTEEEVELMIDEAGIDQGAGDDPGIDFPAFQELVKQMYTAQDEDVWDRARAGIIAMLGCECARARARDAR